MTKITAAVLVLAVGTTFGIGLYNTLAEPVRIIRAYTRSAGESALVTGYIVRDESVMPGNMSVAVLQTYDGAKVASGEKLADIYSGLEDSESFLRIRQEHARLESLRAAEKLSGAEKRRSGGEGVLALSSALAERRLPEAERLSLDAEALIFGTEQEDVAAEIARIETELSSLGTPSGTVTAPRAGIYCAYVDGYESIFPGRILEELTPTELGMIFKNQGVTGGVGKLVYGIRWYFAAVVTESEAERLTGNETSDGFIGKAVKVLIPRFRLEPYSMRAERVGKAYGGYAVAVFSCGEFISDTFAAREVSGEVVFTDTPGLSIPKTALRYDEDGGAYVYSAVVTRALRIDVDVLYDNGESVLVAARTEYPEGQGARANTNAERAAYLRDGAEIILKAKDLYDGKVIR
jgi:hypothetical protein